MVHWVYALKSSSTGAIYVGETVRLYRRWNEHLTGRGGVTTSRDHYDTLVGLYNVAHNWSFLTYRPEMLAGNYNYRCAYYWDEEREKSEACLVENHITERYRFEYKSKNWWNVRGGKYCLHYEIPTFSTTVIDRPLCKCGYPCEVQLKNDQSKLYFTCPVPDWVTFDNVDVPTKCSFWEEFIPYRELKDAHRREYFKKKFEADRMDRIAELNKLTEDDFTT